MGLLVGIILVFCVLWPSLFIVALNDVLRWPKKPKKPKCRRVCLKVLNARIPTPFRLKQTLSALALYAAIAVLAWPAVVVWWVGLRWRGT
jgi:hypothetical protein